MKNRAFRAQRIFTRRGNRRIPIFLAFVLILSGAFLTHTGAAPQPVGFERSVVASGFIGPSAMAWAPDGRLFVAEEGGTIWVIKDGEKLPDPFLEIAVETDGDRGLLGIAFDPNFDINHYVYAYYTASIPTIHNRISRFTADGDVVLQDSEHPILDLETADNIYHQGGGLHFGPDGKLYVSVGENTVGANAQTLSNRLGKILRLNSDGTIPDDNPFEETATGVNRAIWAMGLRNPFTFAFQPGTGRMFINDVGDAGQEEINDGLPGANYGWPATEGYTDDPRFNSPIYAYPHSDITHECAVIGGAFYSPDVATFPAEYVGRYFFADYCAGWLRTLDPDNGNVIEDFATGLKFPSSIGVGPDGAVYALTRGPFTVTDGGALTRFAWVDESAPAIVSQPASQVAPLGQPVTFTVAATGTEPLGYRWRRNGVDIPGETSASYTIPAVQESDEGANFRVLVTSPDGNVLSDAATVEVTIGAAPTANMITPMVGSTYRAGDTISYSATATDLEDGDLSGEDFTWWVDFHHNTHTHEGVAPHTGDTGGSFVVPLVGETATDVFYRIHVLVVDADGNDRHITRDVRPRLSTLQLASSPTGLSVTLDDQPERTPHSFGSVEGQQRTIGATSPQTLGGAQWTFDSWSDRGAGTHNIFVPVADQSYNAVYRVAGGAIGNGTGLRGSYFSNQDFTGATRTRLDPTINFLWGAGRPEPSIEPNTFSVRWAGRIQPQFNGTHTFYTWSDDGARLWVNGVRVINHWGPHKAAEASATVNLRAGVKYPIRLEMQEASGSASIILSWRGPSIPLKSVVPSSQLSPP